jgi:hypothetical protein
MAHKQQMLVLPHYGPQYPFNLLRSDMTNVPYWVHASQAGKRERWKERGKLHGPLCVYITKPPRICSPAENHILVFCKRVVEKESGEKVVVHSSAIIFLARMLTKRISLGCVVILCLPSFPKGVLAACFLLLIICASSLFAILGSVSIPEVAVRT